MRAHCYLDANPDSHGCNPKDLAIQLPQRKPLFSWGGILILTPHYEVEYWYWPPHCEVEYWYWPLTVRWSIDTDPSLWGGVLILTPHCEVDYWYWPLTVKLSIDTDPSLWGGVLILTPHYEVDYWYWPLTMRWTIDTDPLWMLHAKPWLNDKYPNHQHYHISEEVTRRKVKH